LSGSTTIPAEFPVHVAGTVAYGHHSQDESFLPYSANFANPALPQSDLDGDVDTVLANLVVNARPCRDLNVRARYRYYDYQNNTDSIRFTDRSASDGDVVGTRLAANQRSFRRQNLSLDGTWRLDRKTRMTIGYEWQNWYREDRNVTHQNEHIARFTLDSRPSPRTWLRGRYEFRTRGGNSYDQIGGASAPGQFDQTDRTSNQIDLLATLMPRDEVSLTLNAGWTDRSYSDKRIGLDRETGWSAGGEATYQLTERVGFSAYYTFERVRYTQDGDGWRGRSTDVSNDVGTTMHLAIVEDVALRVGYQYHWGKAETEASPSQPDYPSIKDNLQVFSAVFDQRLRDNLRVEYGYRFERFNGTNFKFDDVSVIPPDGTNNVMLRNRVDDYKAHVFLSRLVLEF
ncbi:MAG: MtrB/PioB family outer membrane beta-barrel protein, partial [Deltaproteobacteria bacterium]|nr:MtrB/PioB family outer membrane beta-barrel protein [Deltaproteobacteria bacterium]